MKNTLYAILVSVVLASLPAESKPPIPSPADRSVVVLTQNVYGGVDDLLDAVPQAGNAAELAQRVTAVYEGYFERDFHERAASLARTVDAIRPDLIALQEAILVRTQSPADGPATPATAVALDYVQILLDALVARGLQYEIVVQSANFDAELPSSLGFDVRHTDREVIVRLLHCPSRIERPEVDRIAWIDAENR